MKKYAIQPKNTNEASLGKKNSTKEQSEEKEDDIRNRLTKLPKEELVDRIVSFRKKEKEMSKLLNDFSYFFEKNERTSEEGKFQRSLSSAILEPLSPEEQQQKQQEEPKEKENKEMKHVVSSRAKKLWQTVRSKKLRLHREIRCVFSNFTPFMIDTGATVARALFGRKVNDFVFFFMVKRPMAYLHIVMPFLITFPILGYFKVISTTVVWVMSVFAFPSIIGVFLMLNVSLVKRSILSFDSLVFLVYSVLMTISLYMSFPDDRKYLALFLFCLVTWSAFADAIPSVIRKRWVFLNCLFSIFVCVSILAITINDQWVDTNNGTMVKLGVLEWSPTEFLFTCALHYLLFAVKNFYRFCKNPESMLMIRGVIRNRKVVEKDLDNALQAHAKMTGNKRRVSNIIFKGQLTGEGGKRVMQSEKQHFVLAALKGNSNKAMKIEQE